MSSIKIADICELFWAGGFWDGEGSINAPKNPSRRDYLVPRANANQNNILVLKRLQNAVNMGRIYGPYSRNKQGWSEEYQWVITGYDSVTKFFYLIRPFIGAVKISQGQRILSVYKEYNNGS